MSDLFNSLIDKYNKEQLSEEEIVLLLSSTGTNSVKDAMELLHHIQDNTVDYKAGTRPNKDAAWQKFSQTLANDFPAKPIGKSNAIPRFLRMAMPLVIICAIVIVGFIFFNYRNSGNSIQYVTVQAKVKAIALTDFSQVKLNESSNLKLDADFNKSSRQVNLEGEAFFDISHNKEKPFVIKVKMGSITVLGTQFNVNSASADSVTITVKSGKVAFQPINTKTPFIIDANEELTYYNSTNNANIKKVYGFNAGAWFDKNIKFDASSLSEILDQLSQIYDVKYTIEHPEIKSCKFTGNFNNVGLSEIHSILSKTIPIQILKTGDRIYKISGKACK